MTQAKAKTAPTTKDAITLLTEDHKKGKKMFMDFENLAQSANKDIEKTTLVQRICVELIAHTKIEEEMFYPAVRAAIDDDALMDEALQEHAEAKDAIGRIEAMKANNAGHDAAVKQLGVLIDQHVLEEREQIFLRARLAALDLRGMTLPLLYGQTTPSRTEYCVPRGI